MTQAAAHLKDVELLLFTVGETVFGAEASQVLRIDRVESTAPLRNALGALARQVGRRGLIFRDADREGQLVVDSVLGVRQVPIDTLRRLPKPAGSPQYALGLWLDGEKLVLLVDLVELNRVVRQ